MVVEVVDVLSLAGIPVISKRVLAISNPASRLANLDHNLKVLLIEGGESNLNNPWVFRPGICKLCVLHGYDFG